MRRRFAVALSFLATAACGGPRPPPPPLQARASQPPRSAGTLPTITWTEGAFEVTGLPAVARDGSVVVLARRDADSARGNPNLALVLVDRRDVVIKRMVVLGIEESQEMWDERGPTSSLVNRIKAANELLADLHRSYGLLPLLPLAIDRSAAPEERTRATGGGFVIAWEHDRVVVHHDGKKVVDRATPPSWLAADHDLCSGCAEVCHNPAYLEDVRAQPVAAAAVLTIAYVGTDTCWEPANQQHVVTW